MPVSDPVRGIAPLESLACVTCKKEGAAWLAAAVAFVNGSGDAFDALI